MPDDDNDPRLAFALAITDELRNRAKDDIALLPFLAPLVRGLRDGFEDQTPDPTGTTGAPPAVAAALPAPGAGPALTELLGPIAEATPWRPVVAKHPDVDPILQQGMHAAHIFGSLGTLGCENMRAGLFSLAPGIAYPLHTHIAPELYFCLSGRLTLRHGVDGAPFEIGPGQYSITPRGRAHSLTTGDEPVLLYFAWINELTGPIHWWSEDGAGGWTRSEWTRDNAGIWSRGGEEPVTAEMISEQTLG